MNELDMTIRQQSALSRQGDLSNVPYYIQDIFVQLKRIEYKLDKLLTDKKALANESTKA